MPVKDAFSNTATGYVGTVHFSSTDASAVLPANYTFTSADAGVHNFSAALKTTGTRAISAADTVTGSITGIQSGILVVPSAATSLAVTGFPNPTTAGVTNSFVVTAKDSFNNTATGYVGTVPFTSTDGSANLPADTAFAATNAGVKTFSAALKTAGTQSITGTDTVTGSIAGTQSGILVKPVAASTLLLSGFPNPAV